MLWRYWVFCAGTDRWLTRTGEVLGRCWVFCINMGFAAASSFVAANDAASNRRNRHRADERLIAQSDRLQFQGGYFFSEHVWRDVKIRIAIAFAHTGNPSFDHHVEDAIRGFWQAGDVFVVGAPGNLFARHRPDEVGHTVDIPYSGRRFVDAPHALSHQTTHDVGQIPLDRHADLVACHRHAHGFQVTLDAQLVGLDHVVMNLVGLAGVAVERFRQPDHHVRAAIADPVERLFGDHRINQGAGYIGVVLSSPLLPVQKIILNVVRQRPVINPPMVRPPPLRIRAVGDSQVGHHLAEVVANSSQEHGQPPARLYYPPLLWRGHAAYQLALGLL